MNRTMLLDMNQNITAI
uniref:Umc1301 n=1 Tax=Arundo donax TaxID=35708 RepID=A0A0A9HY09_ARUDO